MANVKSNYDHKLHSKSKVNAKRRTVMLVPEAPVAAQCDKTLKVHVKMADGSYFWADKAARMSISDTQTAKKLASKLPKETSYSGSDSIYAVLSLVSVAPNLVAVSIGAQGPVLAYCLIDPMATLTNHEDTAIPGVHTKWTLKDGDEDPDEDGDEGDD